MKTVNFNIRLEEKLRDEFKRINEERSINASHLVRKWIEEYVNENKGETK